METLNAASASQAERVAVTPVATARPQAAAPSPPVQNSKPAHADTVDISVQARIAANASSSTKPELQVKAVSKGPAVRTDNKIPAAEPSQAEFDVAENNRVVMRILKQPGDSVVKEVPSRDERHIRDTVARLLDNEGNLLAPASRGRR